MIKKMSAMEIVSGYEPSSIERAVKILRSGDVVVFPTETVYGLGADAFNPLAVAKIFEVKKRPHFDPLIVHIGEKDWIFRIAEHVPSSIAALIDRFWPGPLTVIVRKRSIVPDIVTAGLPTVGIRMPSHPVALSLIRTFGQPIAAPSANPFSYMSPTKAEHVARMFPEGLPLILDGGGAEFGIESTIVSVGNDALRVHRHGAVSTEEISRVSSAPLTADSTDEKSSCEAPGELPYHYAPHKPLVLVHTQQEVLEARSSFLAFRQPATRPLSRYVKVLSDRGDMREAAARFFSCLIELDREDVEVIYAERIPETGLGKAMMERLRKAAQKRKHINH